MQVRHDYKLQGANFCSFAGLGKQFEVNQINGALDKKINMYG
jgi:hypothetical protein